MTIAFEVKLPKSNVEVGEGDSPYFVFSVTQEDIETEEEEPFDLTDYTAEFLVKSSLDDDDDDALAHYTMDSGVSIPDPPTIGQVKVQADDTSTATKGVKYFALKIIKDDKKLTVCHGVWKVVNL